MRTMRIKIHTPLHLAVIASVEKERPFSLDGDYYMIRDARRIESTDFIEIKLEKVEV